MSQHGLDTGGTRDQVARLRQQASCFPWAAPLRRLFAAGQLIVDEALVQANVVLLRMPQPGAKRQAAPEQGCLVLEKVDASTRQPCSGARLPCSGARRLERSQERKRHVQTTFFVLGFLPQLGCQFLSARGPTLRPRTHDRECVCG